MISFAAALFLDTGFWMLDSGGAARQRNKRRALVADTMSNEKLAIKNWGKTTYSLAN